MTTIMLIATAMMIGLGAGLVLRRWVAAPARIESVSMEPALQPGQRVLVRPLRSVEGVARGDVVLVRSEELGRVVVKRAVGLPGEHIVLDAGGHVWVDGRRLAEPYARHSPQAVRPATYAVPARSLFLLGDNRPISDDSRSWRQPYLREDALVGRVIRL
ncbi:signal peptidase I [Cumulibacter manganitolerans]|uniref:signal peptidase I n=1 Tax=Cumulibacter manganitolerans TaxID=1884992 RepID=UPI0012953946|nr:signal peptidase I [Cumulibacter manganitolerans]